MNCLHSVSLSLCLTLTSPLLSFTELRPTLTLILTTSASASHCTVNHSTVPHSHCDSLSLSLCRASSDCRLCTEPAVIYNPMLLTPGGPVYTRGWQVPALLVPALLAAVLGASTAWCLHCCPLCWVLGGSCLHWWPLCVRPC